MAANDMIFKLGDTDYSSHVVADGYQVNLKDIYQEWTDGRQVKHRDVIGQKVSGKFQMYFNTADELQTFLNRLSTCKTTDNCYPVQLKINNDSISTMQAKDVFLDFNPVRKRNPAYEDVFEIFEVAVEEP